MKRFICAAFAATIAFTSVSAAFAQPHRDDRGNHDNHGYQRHDDWKKGHRMAQEDWARGERVDYRSHHLRHPPRGYEWRQVDGNYVLAAAATGLIASVIANSH